MATRQIIAEHRDLQVNAMAVDYHGQLALLAGRRTIAIVDLNQPRQVVSKVPRQSKWQIDAVQWNPHASHSQLFVTACNQRADMWSFDGKQSRQQGSLKAHTRVISDLDWSPHQPNTIATCSVDTYTHLWDCRDLRKPKQSLQGIAGVSQVKWNKHNSHLLATCHDGDIRVWDARKANQPIIYIAGHLSKIHGLDWSPHKEEDFTTSSQDGTVKFWNINQPRQAVEKISPSTSPVWKARYTPFGRGLATVVVSQLRRGENNLSLWNLDDLTLPVQTFTGQTDSSDVLLEFQWRQKQDQYQLVTWSKDQTLRILPMDSGILKLLGVESALSDDEGMLFGSGTSAADEDNMPTQSSTDSSNAQDVNGVQSEQLNGESTKSMAQTPPMQISYRRDEIHSPHQPKTLKQEFELVNFDVNNVKLDETDPFKRLCTVTALSSSGQLMVILTMHFPEAYPNNVPPSFDLRTKYSVVKNQQEAIIADLKKVAMQHVHFNRSCIEPCLRKLVESLDQLQEKSDSTLDEAVDEDSSFHGLSRDRSTMAPLALYPPTPIKDRFVPFPRTSGARFSGPGILVCFTRRADPPRRTVSASDFTPRALADLTTYGQQGGRTPQRQSNVFSLFSLATTPPNTASSDMLRQFYDQRDTQSRQHRRVRSKSRSTTRQDSFTKTTDIPSGGAGGGSPKKPRDKQRSVGPVIIYDVECITPINRRLAENYVLDTDNIAQMCSHNAELAASVGRDDLVQLWSLLALAVPPSLHSSLNPDDMPWAAHPFGRQMVKSLIDHYSALCDVQTLAMLTCAIGSKFNPKSARALTTQVSRATSDYTLKSSHATYNTYHTIHSTDSKEWSQFSKSIRKKKMAGAKPSYQAEQATTKTHKRSNSWSDMRENNDGLVAMPRPEQQEKEMHRRNIRLMDEDENTKYDQFKCVYADLLYRMGLFNQRARVLKYVSSQPENHTGIEFKTRCHYCDGETRGVQCFHNNCKQIALQCVICHVGVRGASSFCLACGHGGHADHLMQWFSDHDVCPSGCGCQCLVENPMNPVYPHE